MLEKGDKEIRQKKHINIYSTLLTQEITHYNHIKPSPKMSKNFEAENNMYQ